MKKQSLLFKISFSALFIALTIILSRFFALPALFGISFLKISFANSVVMFSSFLLGPLWGAIVGGAADVIGALLFPQGGAFNPAYTIPAVLTGLCPYFFYKLFNLVKVDKKIPLVLIILLSVFNLFLGSFFIFNDSVKVSKNPVVFSLTLKIVLISLCVALSVIYIIAAIFVKRKFADKKINSEINIFSLITAMFATYMIVKNPVSALITSFFVKYDFLAILFTKILAGFFTCLIHSIIVIIALNVTLTVNMTPAICVNKRIKENDEEAENN